MTMTAQSLTAHMCGKVGVPLCTPGSRRLRQACGHVVRSQPSAAAAPAAPSVVAVLPPAPVVLITGGERSYDLQLLTDDQLREFVTRGVLAIPLDDLSPSVHAEYARTARAMSLAPRDKPKYGNPAQAIGGELEGAMNCVFRSARFHGALHSLLGPDFMVGNNWEDDGSVGYSYRMHVSREDSTQQWHLDGTDHGNTQSTVRDIKPRQLMAFYYPNGATMGMGPTAVASSSHYYNLDREGSGSSEDALLPKEADDSVAISPDEMAREEWFAGSGPPLQLLGGDTPELDDLRLVVPPGSVVLCGHHSFHRATRATPGAAWRCMFKLNIARVSEPLPRHGGGMELALERGSTAERHRPVWSSTLAWLRGEAPPALLPAPAQTDACEIEETPSEVDAVNRAVALGLDGGQAAVQTLSRAFVSAESERGRRAAMHGLGQTPAHQQQRQDGAAVEFLLAQVWGGSDGTRFRQQSNVTGAVHALGQCVLKPSLPVVRALEHAVDRAIGALHDQATIAAAAAKLSPDEPAPELDFTSLEQRRTIAEACWALGLIGHRAMVAATDGSGAAAAPLSTLLATVVAVLMRVLSTEPEIGREFRSYLWVNTVRNQAAFGLVRLASLPGLTAPSLPSFRDHAAPNRILHGMVADAIRRAREVERVSGSRRHGELAAAIQHGLDSACAWALPLRELPALYEPY